ncbi:MltR family transcriptional regulator [Vibrio agarivorans]|uniref:MltR family transcriptional regulator n=1 Tax=Vibrio agarivorans TaxID=153622 RepID=UPI002230770C|nr:MltR family transcriptional regulator [Vibrio agarivorans]
MINRTIPSHNEHFISQEDRDFPSEADLLEVISQADSEASVFSAVYHAIDDAIAAVMQGLFASDDYAIKNVIEPLLSIRGPLGDMMMRTKVLLGLQVIPKALYEDIVLFCELKELAEVTPESVTFTDLRVLNLLRSIKAIQRSMHIEYDPSMLSGLSQSMMDMFIARHNQKVKSTIVLAVTDIVNSLRTCFINNPFKSFS